MLIASARPALASSPQVFQLTPDDPASGAGRFGAQLATSGDTLVVGEPDSSRGGALRGAAIVYVRDGAGWHREAVLLSPDGQYNSGFGSAVAIEGDTIAVGAPKQNAADGSTGAGKVYLYTRSAGIWSFQGALTEGSGSFDSRFGRSILLNGGRLLISADAIGSGKVYLYEYRGAAWAITASFSPERYINLGDFGSTLDIDGDTLVVGAPSFNAAYVYTFAPAVGWALAQKLNVDRAGEAYPNLLGGAVAISGGTIVVSAMRYNSVYSPAVAYVFTQAGAAWQLTAALSEADDTEARSYGAALAIAGDTLVVGAPNHHLEGYDVPNAAANGAAYLYRRAGAGWQPAGLLSGGSNRSAYRFGAALLLAGDEISVGAPQNDGAVYQSPLSALTRAADDSVSTPESTPVTVMVLANDIDGLGGSPDPAAVDVTLLHPPLHGAASVDRATGEIRYTPAQGYNGTDSFTYVAGWGLPATVRVSVTPLPDPPRFISAPVTTAVEQVPYTYTVAASDPDPGDVVQITAPALPAWLTLRSTGSGAAVLSGTAAPANVGAQLVTLVATDRDGLSATQTFTISVAPYAPPAPAGLAASVRSRSQVQLGWNDTSPYEQLLSVERRENGGAWHAIATLFANTTAYTDSMLTCNTAYDYRVFAQSSYAPSPPSNMASATIADCSIDAPAGLGATLTSTTTVALSWSDLSDNESGFLIERSPAGAAAWQEIGRVSAGKVAYVDQLGGCSAEVAYRVRAFNPGQASAPSNVVRTSLCPPAAAEGFGATSASQTSIAFTWADRSNNESRFRVQASADGLSWSTMLILPADSTSALLESQTCGVTRLFRVVSDNPAGSTASSTIRASTAPCDILYVDQRARGAKDGSSWANAFVGLQDALASAASRPPNTAQIWVAEGTYRPTNGADRTATFALASGAALYGGFAGNESSLTERRWREHVTVLSGDIGAAGVASDNSYHVVSSTGAGPNTVLDGLTITAGQADGPWTANQHIGGGLFNDQSSPTVHNVLFLANAAGTGGGMGNAGASPAGVGSNPYVDHVSFIGNQARQGGGMGNAYGSSPIVVNTLFSGNSAIDGGALYNYWSSSPTLVNVTIAYNHASGWGGAMNNSAQARPQLYNTIIWGNTAQLAGEIAQIYNSASSTSVSDSLLQANLDGSQIGGARNRLADPRFVDADGADNRAGTADDDLRLQLDSPAIDAGNNGSLPVDAATDLADSPRRADNVAALDSGVGAAPLVDIGAYEYQPQPPPSAGPTGLRAGQLTRLSISIVWEAPAVGEVGFAIERRLEGGAWVELARTSAAALSYEDRGLPCGASFEYRLRAFTTGGFSQPTPVLRTATEGCEARVYYVDSTVAAAGDGRSWASAFAGLQDALTGPLLPGDEVWVAAGRYTPTSGSDRIATFRIMPGLAVYGGFAGGERSRAERDWRANPTILDGDLLANDGSGTPGYSSLATNLTDNSRHVVTIVGGNASTVLDGFTVARGNALVDPHIGYSGGGVLIDGGQPELGNLILLQNTAQYGGGVAVQGGAAPILHDMTFVQNFAYTGGGAGLSSQSSSPDITGARFEVNTTYAARGAMYSEGGRATLRDAVFVNNDSYWGGGGLDSHNSQIELVDVRFVTNSGDSGGLYSEGGSSSLLRVRFIGNRGRFTSGAGGLYNAQSVALLVDVDFIDNESALQGGGMITFGSDPTLINVRFLGNRLTSTGGFANGAAGMYNLSGSPRLYNVIFSGNKDLTAQAGVAAAFASADGHPVLVNASISGNSSQSGAALTISGGAATLQNSIVWDNGASFALTNNAALVASYSIVAGGAGGTGNRDVDPRFVDADGADDIVGTADDDLQLMSGSPAVDAGDNTARPADGADLDGDGDRAEPLPLDASRRPRASDDLATADTGLGQAPVIDIGAYELPGIVLTPTTTPTASPTPTTTPTASPTPTTTPPGSPQHPPSLVSNYHEGRPGSTFVIRGAYIGVQSHWQLRIDGVIVDRLTSSAKGELTLVLSTPVNAREGTHLIALLPEAGGAVVVANALELRFTLASSAPLRARSPDASGYELTLPITQQIQYRLYLPVLAR